MRSAMLETRRADDLRCRGIVIRGSAPLCAPRMVRMVNRFDGVRAPTRPPAVDVLNFAN